MKEKKMTTKKDKEALKIEAEIDNLETGDEPDERMDILLEVTGIKTYPLFSKWLDTEIAGVTLKANKTDNDMNMVIHAKDGRPEQTLRVFSSSCDNIRIPSIMKDYILFREWYSRLDTEPCIDFLVYADKKSEFTLITVDTDSQILIFPNFTWAAPIELVEDWLTKRGESAYRTTFEFPDVAAWLDHEITNTDLQPSLLLNYEDGPSICISGMGTSKSEEVSLETKYPESKVKNEKEKGD